MKAALPISIVTPSFNQGHFLEETVVSVLDQNYPDLEYVVIDGGSTDNSPEVLRRYKDRLAHWCSEPDGGQYHAINKGFAQTKGEVMGWLNSDDKHTPWALSIVGEIFETFPEVEWLTTQYPLRWDKWGRAVRCSRRDGFSRAACLAGENLPTGAWYAPGWLQQESTFWRRSLWERAGGKIDTQWKIAADFELWLRFFQHAELYAVDTPLAGFRQHGDQKTNQLKNEYQREATQILREGGGVTPGYFRSSLRSAAARHCPDFLRPLAAGCGLLHPCKLCLRRRDETGWRITPALH
ncbi:MAG: glycosyltransferase family 2 protein [Chthoniobacter sp.]|nr:glycosyltransferase family 2 protein [Chthoniobacter sp.]